LKEIAKFPEPPSVTAAELSENGSDRLTPKELRILSLLSEGCSNETLAEKLFVSTNTIRTHLRNINSKLNVSNRTEAVAVARKLGAIR
jgi:LuxR family maltose regulon positive regulatory protein